MKVWNVPDFCGRCWHRPYLHRRGDADCGICGCSATMKPGPSKGHGGRPRKKASEGPDIDAILSEVEGEKT